jgi:hypothetical protein
VHNCSARTIYELQYPQTNLATRTIYDLHYPQTNLATTTIYDLHYPQTNLATITIYDLHYPQTNLAQFQKGLFCMEIKIFNHLPTNFKFGSNDLRSFNLPLTTFFTNKFA